MNKTIATYDKHFEDYRKEVQDFWLHFPQETISAFVSRLQGKKVLDIGSGPGDDAQILKKNNLEVICVDGSLSMVNKTKELGFESYQKYFREIDFPDGSFDGIWAYTSLLHVSSEEASEVVGKIYQMLKSGGVFLIGMIEGEFEGDKESWEQSERYFKFYTEKELTDMVSHWGFKRVYQERYKPHSKTYLAQVYLK
ncbi:MAG: hypothetical protein LiPW41_536 [Parcubacteria group bacterium LiPW_41]|nr:MAG: hypothetical protein LiPW41_536 [Parcubacteria group bacterium LiPW_41]